MAEARVMNALPDEALELIHIHVVSDETRPFINTVIYTTVLERIVMARRSKHVFSTYEEMRKRSVALNSVTFNTMLTFCAKCHVMHRASSLVKKMRQSAVELVIITFSTLVKGYCCEGHVDHAFRVVDEMKKESRKLRSRQNHVQLTLERLSGETERGRGSATFQRDASGSHCSLRLRAQHHGEALGLRAALVPGLSVG